MAKYKALTGSAVKGLMRLSGMVKGHFYVTYSSIKIHAHRNVNHNVTNIKVSGHQNLLISVVHYCCEL